MQVASRPRLNAGIALVGASVIAVCPLAPPLPDIHLPNPAHVVASVELAAASAAAPPSYAQVIQEAVANAQALLTTFAANPTPCPPTGSNLEQILALNPTRRCGRPESRRSRWRRSDWQRKGGATRYPPHRGDPTRGRQCPPRGDGVDLDPCFRWRWA